jgi:hypothetical protein
VMACKKVEEERERVAQWISARLREGSKPHEIGGPRQVRGAN